MSVSISALRFLLYANSSGAGCLALLILQDDYVLIGSLLKRESLMSVPVAKRVHTALHHCLVKLGVSATLPEPLPEP